MNILILNICALVAWMMILIGGMLALGIGYGLVAGGVSLIALTLITAHVAGGFYAGKATD